MTVSTIYNINMTYSSFFGTLFGLLTRNPPIALKMILMSLILVTKSLILVSSKCYKFEEITKWVFTDQS